MSRSETVRRLPWIFGIVLLAAVVVVVSHVSEARDFARLTEQARPWWLLVAIVCQVATYVSQGRVYRMIVRAGGQSLGVVAAARLSLVKLFVDQAIPSGGFGGTAVVAGALDRRGLSRRIVSAGVVVDLAGNAGSYVLCLLASLVIVLAGGRASVIVLISAAVYVLLAVASTTFAISLAGRGRGRGTVEVPRRLARFRFVRAALDFVRDADPRLARSRSVLFRSGAYHAAILVCDAATIWALIRAFGGSGRPDHVFASFIISNLLGMLAFVPGGLGTFEAASVVTLRVAGVPAALGLAATLVFRGLSFWLPMLPGFWIWRGEIGHARGAGRREAPLPGENRPPPAPASRGTRFASVDTPRQSRAGERSMAIRLQEIHPAAVHLPIALLPVAVVADIAGRATGNRELLDLGRRAIGIAAVGAAVSAVSGLIAQEEVNVQGEARDMLITHRNINLAATIVAGLMAVWRSRREGPTLGYLAVGLAGIGAVGYSAYLGGTLVYQHGVGVEPAKGQWREHPPELGRRGQTAAFARDAANDVVQGVKHLAQELEAGQLVPSLTGGQGSPATDSQNPQNM